MRVDELGVLLDDEDLVAVDQRSRAMAVPTLPPPAIATLMTTPGWAEGPAPSSATAVLDDAEPARR